MRSPAVIRMTGFGLAGTFAVFGIIFVAIPDQVLAAFNWLARGIGWPQSTGEAHTLFLALAVGYMYMVTLLAWQMARRPDVRMFPWLLTQAKGASAILCIALFALQEQYLLYLANFVVDGAIALGVWWLCLRNPADASGAASARSRSRDRR